MAQLRTKLKQVLDSLGREIITSICGWNYITSALEECNFIENWYQQVATQAVNDYLSNDLGLPELLTDRQKQDLSKLTQERAKLLVFCIETIKNEMDAKGFEFYENSCRSLGVSLFIHISRHLP